VPAAPPIKYVLGYRSRTRTVTLNLNPNPITDPNPNPKNNKKRKRHRNEIEHRVISKSRCTIRTGVGLYEAYNQQRKLNTYGRSRLLVVLPISSLRNLRQTGTSQHTVQIMQMHYVAKSTPDVMLIQNAGMYYM